ncbi:MAG: PAS domain S-box protein [Bacillota bacterium]|nr:PAS domain S-box protein [Bacillota bacterium]
MKSFGNISLDRLQDAVNNLIDCFAILCPIRNEEGSILDFSFEYINETGMNSSFFADAYPDEITLLKLLSEDREHMLLQGLRAVMETKQPFTKKFFKYEELPMDKLSRKVYHVKACSINEGIIVTWNEQIQNDYVKEGSHLDFKQLNITEDPKRRLAAIVESTDDAIVGEALDGTITSWNIGAEITYGYKAEEIIGRSIFTIVPQNRRKEMINILSRISSGDKISHFESTRMRKDGVIINISATFSPIFDSQGIIVGVSTIARDITQHKIMEEAHRESEERFRAAFEHAAIGIALVSLDGRWLKVNQALCSIVGYSEKELLEINFQMITHPDDLEKDLNYVGKLLRGEIKSFNMEKRYIHKKGQNIWILLSGSLVRDCKGNPLYFIGEIQDISKRKQAEKELQKKNEELRIQRAEAIEANRLKGQFLANMSHELRTPLNSIIGFTTRVIRKCEKLLPPRQLENLLIVKKESYHLLDLINSLLDYSKLEAGKMELYLNEFDLLNVIKEVETIIKIMSEEKNVKYIGQFGPMDNMLMVSDSTKIRQILINILSNAFKYSEKGTVILSVDKDDKLYRISIQDNGIGIAPEDIENIFDEFRQIDGSCTRKVGGTGLGLSITKKFVEMLNGSIEVVSALGEGSCFTIYLPINLKKTAGG